MSSSSGGGVGVGGKRDATSAAATTTSPPKRHQVAPGATSSSSAVPPEPVLPPFPRSPLGEALRDKAIACARAGTPLDKEQLQVLYLVAQRKHVAVVGEGGTGKSRLIKLLDEVMSDLDGDDGAIICAPTGVAARNVGGTTVHRLLRIKPLRVRSGDSRISVPREFCEDCKHRSLLVLDEFSMANEDVFRHVTAAVRRCNLRLAVFGDPFQLAPVTGEPCYVTRDWKQLFGPRNTVVLKTNYRQNNKGFQAHLRNIRLGTVIDKTEHFFTRRNLRSISGMASAPKWLPPGASTLSTVLAAGATPVMLMHSRAEVAELNRVAFERFRLAGAETEEFKTTVEIGKTGTSHDGVQVVKDMNTEECFSLAVGSRVMVTVNLDQEEGVVNGATGTVIAFSWNPPDFGATEKAVRGRTVHVQLDDNRGTFMLGRHAFKRYGAEKRANVVLATAFQHPLIAAHAITVHRAQGLQFSGAVAVRPPSARRPAPIPGLVYTALSRAKDPRELLLDYEDGRLGATIAASEHAVHYWTELHEAQKGLLERKNE